jgi:hypothetical protein
MASNQGQEVQDHYFPKAGNYLVKTGYNSKEIKQLEVKQVAGNYILCRLVLFNGNELPFDWKVGSDFTWLQTLPDGTAEVQ